MLTFPVPIFSICLLIVVPLSPATFGLPCHYLHILIRLSHSTLLAYHPISLPSLHHPHWLLPCFAIFNGPACSLPSLVLPSTFPLDTLRHGVHDP